MAFEEVPPQGLRWEALPRLAHYDPGEAPPLPGQAEALGALRELATRGEGHLCVAMPPGVGDAATVARLLRSFQLPRRGDRDLLFVPDLEDAEHPLLLELPAGQGRRFQRALAEALTELLHGVPAELGSPLAAERQAFERELDLARAELARRVAAGFPPELGLRVVLEDRQLRVVVQRGEERLGWEELLFGESAGGGEPGEEDELVQALARARTLLAGGERELEARLLALAEDLFARERERVEALLARVFDPLERSFPGARRWLRQLRGRVRDRYWFLQDGADDSLFPAYVDWLRVRGTGTPWRLGGLEEDSSALISAFSPNVLHRGRRGGRAPVLLLQDPSAARLLGGMLTDPGGSRRPDWRDLRAGALVEARGGFLVLPLRPLLGQSAAWSGLKRALEAGQLLLGQRGSAPALRPDPVPLSVRVVLVGPPSLCALLHDLDSSFRSLFRQRVEFADEAPLEPGLLRAYAAFLHRRAVEAGLPPPTRDGVAALLEEARARAEEPSSLSLAHLPLLDVAAEAARLAGGPWGREQVEAALERRRHRRDLAERQLLRAFQQGIYVAELRGRRVGQVNGLAVYRVADHSFGRVLRITATVGSGRKEVVNIEREAGLSGRLHDKGVQVLTGFLRGEFGRHRPFSLTASIGVEQSYGRLDGDSATCAEAAALLSALSGVPLRQDRAVTGSMDQLGRLQAVGGVAEKVEAFYRLCQSRPAPGQGVIVPAANARELHLPREVVQACREGRFHVWRAETLADVLELLTDLPAGERDERGGYPEGSLFARVAEGLEALHAVARRGAGQAREPASEKD